MKSFFPAVCWRAVCQGIAAVALLSIAGPFTEPARAWGPEGHEVIARIADVRLPDHIRRNMKYLFRDETTLQSIAAWADEIRVERPYTTPWHYINIPPSAEGVDWKPDCPEGNCITVKIREFAGIVRLAIKTREERQEALQFLVHLVGDLHQPLNAGFLQDHGGNDTTVTFGGEEMTLHEFWDGALIGHKSESTEDLANRLSAEITPEQEHQWRKGNSRDWTWESHEVAARNAYANLPAGTPKQIDQEYAARARRVTEEQLMKAGIRLVRILEDVWPQQ